MLRTKWSCKEPEGAYSGEWLEMMEAVWAGLPLWQIAFCAMVAMSVSSSFEGDVSVQAAAQRQLALLPSTFPSPLRLSHLKQFF